MKLKVFTKDGASSEEKEFNTMRTFTDDKGLASLHQVLKAYMANQRQGNACAKDRGDVSGTSKKPYRQKGTGMARHGSKRSPIWTKGGVVFGPKPRDYSQKINRRMRQLAFQRALFNCAQEGSLMLIEQITVQQPKTKHFDQLLSKIHPEGKVLVVDLGFEDNAVLSARNLDRVFMVDANSINAWDLVRYSKVLMSEQGFQRVLERSHHA